MSFPISDSTPPIDDEYASLNSIEYNPNDLIELYSHLDPTPSLLDPSTDTPYHHPDPSDPTALIPSISSHNQPQDRNVQAINSAYKTTHAVRLPITPEEAHLPSKSLQIRHIPFTALTMDEIRRRRMGINRLITPAQFKQEYIIIANEIAQELDLDITTPNPPPLHPSFLPPEFPIPKTQSKTIIPPPPLPVDDIMIDSPLKVIQQAIDREVAQYSILLQPQHVHHHGPNPQHSLPNFSNMPRLGVNIPNIVELEAPLEHIKQTRFQALLDKPLPTGKNCVKLHDTLTLHSSLNPAEAIPLDPDQVMLKICVFDSFTQMLMCEAIFTDDMPLTALRDVIGTQCPMDQADLYDKELGVPQRMEIERVEDVFFENFITKSIFTGLSPLVRENVYKNTTWVDPVELEEWKNREVIKKEAIRALLGEFALDLKYSNNSLSQQERNVIINQLESRYGIIMGNKEFKNPYDFYGNGLNRGKLLKNGEKNDEKNNSENNFNLSDIFGPDEESFRTKFNDLDGFEYYCQDMSNRTQDDIDRAKNYAKKYSQMLKLKHRLDNPTMDELDMEDNFGNDINVEFEENTTTTTTTKTTKKTEKKIPKKSTQNIQTSQKSPALLYSTDSLLQLDAEIQRRVASLHKLSHSNEYFFNTPLANTPQSNPSPYHFIQHAIELNSAPYLEPVLQLPLTLGDFCNFQFKKKIGRADLLPSNMQSYHLYSDYQEDYRIWSSKWFPVITSPQLIQQSEVFSGLGEHSNGQNHPQNPLNPPNLSNPQSNQPKNAAKSQRRLLGGTGSINTPTTTPSTAFPKPLTSLPPYLHHLSNLERPQHWPQQPLGWIPEAVLLPHPSSFFFFGSNFYDDRRSPLSISLSTPIIKHSLQKHQVYDIHTLPPPTTQKEQKNALNLPISTPFLREEPDTLTPQYAQQRHLHDGLGIFRQFRQESTVFGNVPIRIGEQYLFQHQGHCQHIIMVTEMRIKCSDDYNDKRMYPLVIFRQDDHIHSRQRHLNLFEKKGLLRYIPMNQDSTYITKQYDIDQDSLIPSMMPQDETLNGSNLGSFRTPSHRSSSSTSLPTLGLYGATPRDRGHNQTYDPFIEKLDQCLSCDGGAQVLVFASRVCPMSPTPLCKRCSEMLHMQPIHEVAYSGSGGVMLPILAAHNDMVLRLAKGKRGLGLGKRSDENEKDDKNKQSGKNDGNKSDEKNGTESSNEAELPLFPTIDSIPIPLSVTNQLPSTMENPPLPHFFDLLLKQSKNDLNQNLNQNSNTKLQHPPSLSTLLPQTPSLAPFGISLALSPISSSSVSILPTGIVRNDPTKTGGVMGIFSDFLFNDFDQKDIIPLQNSYNLPTKIIKIKLKRRPKVIETLELNRSLLQDHGMVENDLDDDQNDQNDQNDNKNVNKNNNFNFSNHFDHQQDYFYQTIGLIPNSFMQQTDNTISDSVHNDMTDSQ